LIGLSTFALSRSGFTVLETRKQTLFIESLHRPSMDGFYGARTFFMSGRTRADLARATAFTEMMAERM